MLADSLTVMSLPGFSVVVCCHNSVNRLNETFLHLARQEVNEKQSWELILVDNASTDGTSEIAAKLWIKLNSPCPFYLVREVQPGLSYARRAGVLQARFDFIIFCDDDNWLAPDYASRAVRLLQARPDVGVVGGRCKPVLEGLGTVYPEWFFTYADSYAVGVQSLRSGDVTSRGYVWGAGMALRASLLKHIYSSGAQSCLSDRKGSKLSSGGDSEICRWYQMAGFRLWYEEAMQLCHFVPCSRQCTEYVERLRAGLDEADQVLWGYHLFISRRQINLLSLRGFVRLVIVQIRFLMLPTQLRSSIGKIGRLINQYRSEDLSSTPPTGRPHFPSIVEHSFPHRFW